MAVCQEPRFQDAECDTLLNPIMIAEVLSPTTEAYVRGDKFRRYRRLPSLREYVLVARDQVLVERFTLQDGEWLRRQFKSRENMLRLASIDCEVSLREIYARIEFHGEK
jgi:Uma2 family endonuclease